MGCGASTGGGVEQSKPKVKTDENVEFQKTMEFLAKVPMFKQLPKDYFPLLGGACTSATIKKGQSIIKQGEDGSEFFIIKRGDASVSVEEKGSTRKLAVLKAGDYFGERALLRDEPRSATITAESECAVLKISREQFTELGLNEQVQFPNRKAVVGGGRPEIRPPSDKTAAEKELIASALRANENLNTMARLDETRINAFIATAWKETVPAGTKLISQGDTDANYFYVVQDGCFTVEFAEEDEQGEAGEKAHSETSTLNRQAVQQGFGNVQLKADAGGHSVSAGGSFGELALLVFGVPRVATVLARQESTVWVFDRHSFKSILMAQNDEKVQEYVSILNRVELLASLLIDEKWALAKALVETRYANGDNIITQGEAGLWFYILVDGEVTIIKDGEQTSKLVAAEGTEAKTFGERALLNGEPRAATMQVTSESAKVLGLDREIFDMLLGPLEDIIKRGANGTSNVKQLTLNPQDKPRENIKRKDLRCLGLLGSGGFGAVELYEHVETHDTYAMKMLQKGLIVKSGTQTSVMNEKNILMMTNSSFIIRLWETFVDEKHLFFLLEPALGGELYATYCRKGFHGSQRHAKFYSAGTILAFEHLHRRHIIYRDLKPENLLLNEKGKLLMTDMGLAKFVVGKTFSSCGTPDYFCPEIIQSRGHNAGVDWWTLGILIFELMVGHPPFESAAPMQIYAKVMKGINEVHFPKRLLPSLVRLIKELVVEDPSMRLPMKPNGTKLLMSHEWYEGFDWTRYADLQMEPPYKPVVKSKKDIANFKARKEDMPRPVAYKDDGSGWDDNFATST